MLIPKSWNAADKTLFAAAVFFAFALCLHLEYPSSRLASCFLFCTEAALVGGIADWFAVTALFRKPLGFPWHTAILPRRRKLFVEASVQMVQQEFFSRKKVFQRLQKIDFTENILCWLQREETKDFFGRQLKHQIKFFLSHLKPENLSAEFASKIDKRLQSITLADLTAVFQGKLESETADKAMSQINEYLRNILSQPETKAKLEAALEEYQSENFGGGLASLFAGLMKGMNIVNYAETAELIQEQALSVLDRAADKNSAEYKFFLTNLGEVLQELAADENFAAYFAKCWQQIIESIEFRKIALEFLQDYKTRSKAQNLSEIEEMEELTAKIIQQAVDAISTAFTKDEVLRHDVFEFLYDVAARCALHAQAMAGVVVRDVLSGLTDEQLNKLVYDKVEPDLLWIRMNGSIVGASIGAVFYLLFVLVPSHL